MSDDGYLNSLIAVSRAIGDWHLEVKHPAEGARAVDFHSCRAIRGAWLDVLASLTTHTLPLRVFWEPFRELSAL